MTALTKSLASEWADRGVRVNAVPRFGGTSDTYFSNGSTLPPQHRMAEPSEIAAAVAFLLSDEAGHFCGSELVVDGGYSLR